MKTLGRILVVIGVVASAFQADVAFAQVPPHVPGTICFTPQFWCWAPQAGPPGYPCGCPSQFGWVPGTLG